MVRLGEITQIRTGKLDANAQRPGGPYPFFTCGEETLEIDHFAFDTEAILLAGNGNFNVKWYHGKFNAYQRTYVIEPNGVSGKWLFYAVQAALRTITKGNRGSVIRFLRIGDIVDSTVCVPPPDEQKQIVAEIEKQFTRLEAGVSALKCVQANLKRYRAAVLKAACEGKIVPTEAELRGKLETGNLKPEFESGEELLARILEERRKNWSGRGKYKEPAAPDTAILPPLPEGWTWANVEQLSFLDIGFAFKSAEFQKSGIRLLRGDNLEPGKMRWSDTRYWSESKLDEFRHLLIREGEIVLAMDRPLISSGLKIARARVDDLPCLLVQRMARFRPVVETMTPFLFMAMNTHGFIKHLLGGQTGTQLPHIRGTGIQSFLIPLPPLAEQSRIVEEVERRLSVVEELEAVVSANLQRAGRLRQSILQKAFSGELAGHDGGHDVSCPSASCPSTRQALAGDRNG